MMLMLVVRYVALYCISIVTTPPLVSPRVPLQVLLEVILVARPPSHQPGPRILGFLGLLGPGLPLVGQAGFEGPEQQDHLQRDLLALILPWARLETSGHHPQ